MIDATGDGDIAAKSGLPFKYGRTGDGLVQGMTLMFRLSGVDPDAVKSHLDTAQRVLELMKTLRDERKFPQFLEHAARHYPRNPQSPYVSYNMCPAVQSYQIPLGMCLNFTAPNLAVVGRCASSTHEGHSSVRVQTHCMVMGQGVGTCAALG